MSLTIAPRRVADTFLGATPVTSLDGLLADIAFLGVPYGQAYSYDDITNDQSNAPTAMRRASSRIVRSLERYDFDLGGPLYAGRRSARWTAAISAAISAILRALPPHRAGGARDPGRRRTADRAGRRSRRADPGAARVRGTRPDHAGADRPAHRLARRGERRARGAVQSDQARIRDGAYRQIFQIGLRATGSARQEEVDAALAYGAHLIPAWELHEIGMDAVLARIPDGEAIISRSIWMAWILRSRRRWLRPVRAA